MDYAISRLFSPIFAVASFVAALGQEHAFSLACSLVAIGSVVGPAVLKAFRAWKEAQRQERLKDAQTDTQLLDVENLKRAKIEQLLAECKRKISDLETSVKEICPNCDEPPCNRLKTPTQESGQ